MYYIMAYCLPTSYQNPENSKQGGEFEEELPTVQEGRTRCRRATNLKSRSL